MGVSKKRVTVFQKFPFYGNFLMQTMVRNHQNLKLFPTFSDTPILSISAAVSFGKQLYFRTAAASKVRETSAESLQVGSFHRIWES